MDFACFDDSIYPDTFIFPKRLCVKFRNLLHRKYQFGEIVRVQEDDVGINFYTFKLEEIILIYLRRMVVPDRLSEVSSEFFRTMEEILSASAFMADQLNAISQEYLDRGPSCWDESQVRYNAGLVNKFDVPLSDVCLFIDAATVQMEANQWIYNVEAGYFYSGLSRQAKNMFYLAVCPQGLYIFVSEVSEGGHHGMAEAMQHNVYPKMKTLTMFPGFEGKAFGNSQFSNIDPVYTPYSIVDTKSKKVFNKKMTAVSVTSEWALEIVRSLWPSVKYISKQKIQYGNLPSKNLYNSFFMANLYTCYLGTNLIAEHFGSTTMPSIEEYWGVPENFLD